ncbi:MAG: Phosphoesterase family, partial [Caballeronia sp.]|nr:Phosphoesterase family [Caballeronia sp.]
GVRVPALVISLYVAPGTSVRTLYDHTSVLKSVEKLR